MSAHNSQDAPASPSERRAVLVSSPNAGNAIRAEDLAAHLARAGVTVAQSLLVSELDHAQPQGTHWRNQGYELAIAAGGDGTIGSVASHLAGSGIPLAILPMGTANDVARSLHLPMDIAAACSALAGAVPMDIDAGQVLPALAEPGAYSAERQSATLAGEPSPVVGVYFLHTATLGLNVEFARLATDSLRRQRLGKLTYAASALEAVTQYRPVDVTLRVYGMAGAGGSAQAETVIYSHAVQVSIVNTPVFGGRMGMRLPDVNLHDRQLDFMMIEAIDAWQLRHTVEQLLAAIESATEPLHLPGVRRFRAEAAVIATADAVDMTLDGEIRTHTPALVRVAPQPVRVLVSPQAKRLLTNDQRSGGTDSPAH